MTAEGRVARDIADRPGVWKRAGQIATIVGLDWPAALGLVPEGVDRERVNHLLRNYEAGMVEGVAKQAKARTPKEEE